MYTEIVKIIEGGIMGDREKVYNYAKALAANLKNDGNEALAKKIMDTLNNKKSKMVSLDEFSTKPVDQESKMDMVNVEYASDSFEDVVLDKFISEEITSFIQQYYKRDELLQLGLDNNSSLLLYGPPGCGKTTLAKYISFKTGLPLVTVRLDALVSSLLGSTSKNIRKVFDYANRRECILFLDEFDVVAKLRDDKHELGELKRVVNSLIQNIDEFTGNSILIAATNHHELLDPAIWRRFSKTITLNAPTKMEIIELIQIISKKMENSFVDNSKRQEQLAMSLSGLSHADITTIITNSMKKKIINNEKLLHHWDILTEVYYFKNHTVINENDFIKYLSNHGITHKEINENFNISLRKIRDAAKLDI